MCPFLYCLLRLPAVIQPAVAQGSGLVVIPLKDTELSFCVTLFKCLIKLNLACLDPVMSFFYSFFLGNLNWEVFVPIGPGEEINHLLKELPWGQGVSPPGSQLCPTLQTLITLISAEVHLGTEQPRVFGMQPWVSPGGGSFPARGSCCSASLDGSGRGKEHLFVV